MNVHKCSFFLHYRGKGKSHLSLPSPSNQQLCTVNAAELNCVVHIFSIYILGFVVYSFSRIGSYFGSAQSSLPSLKIPRKKTESVYVLFTLLQLNCHIAAIVHTWSRSLLAWLLQSMVMRMWSGPLLWLCLVENQRIQVSNDTDWASPAAEFISLCVY